MSFWENAWVGFLTGIAVLVLAGFLFWWGFHVGHHEGWETAITDMERQGHGRWVELELDGKWFRGWLK